MRETQIRASRLFNQHISKAQFTDPGELVQWLGAVQAQDYAGSLWAIGLRLKRNIEADIENAIVQKKIVRSWPMRGTLHFTSATDLRWMLKYLTPRVIQRSASLYRQAELDKKVFTKSTKILVNALRDGQQLTRNQLYDALERGKVATGNQSLPT